MASILIKSYQFTPLRKVQLKMIVIGQTLSECSQSSCWLSCVRESMRAYTCLCMCLHLTVYCTLPQLFNSILALAY